MTENPELDRLERRLREKLEVIEDTLCRQFRTIEDVRFIQGRYQEIEAILLFIKEELRTPTEEDEEDND